MRPSHLSKELCIEYGNFKDLRGSRNFRELGELKKLQGNSGIPKQLEEPQKFRRLPLKVQ